MNEDNLHSLLEGANRLNEKLEDDIVDLKWHLKNAQEKQEQAYLRGLKEGYNKGSKAGVQMVADHMVMQVTPRFIVKDQNGIEVPVPVSFLGPQPKTVKAPAGDHFEWVTAEEASARLFTQKKSLEGQYKLIDELHKTIQRLRNDLVLGPFGGAVGFGPVGGTVRTEQKPVPQKNKCGVSSCNRPVRSDHSEFCQQCWDNQYPQPRQWDTGDPWD